jgi:hypothetical protein
MELKWLSFDHLKENILKKKTRCRTHSSAIEDQGTTTTLNNNSTLGSHRNNNNNRTAMDQLMEDLNTLTWPRDPVSLWRQTKELTTATGAERHVSLRSAQLGIPTLNATTAKCDAPINHTLSEETTTDPKTNSTKELELMLQTETTMLSESDPHPWLTMALIQDLLSSIRDLIAWKLW